MKRWELFLYWVLLAAALGCFVGAVWLAFHAPGLLREVSYG